MIHLANNRLAPAWTLSSVLAFCIPLVLGLYWIIYARSPDTAILLLRPALIGFTILLTALWPKRRITRAEVDLVKVLALFCGALLVPSLTATDPARALSDWVKVVLLSTLCLLWCRMLRDQGTTRIMGISLIMAACMLMLLILAIYVAYMGLTLPTYKSAREFKGMTEKIVPLNAVPFAALMAYLSAMCILRTSRLFWFMGVALFVISTVFTGSRTPAAIVVLSAVVVGLTILLRSPRLMVQLSAWTCIALMLVVASVGAMTIPSRTMSKVTEGRWDLWSVAAKKFVERPILGYGYESWRDDLVSRLPGEYSLTLNLAKQIAGGYHNEYLTMLAEQGLVGTIPTLYFYWFVLSTSWKLGFRRSHTWKKGYWALFGSLILLTRASVEMPGLFGYAQEPADYLAFLFVAFVVSRLSVEEDYLREQVQLIPQKVTAPFMRINGFRSSPNGIAHI